MEEEDYTNDQDYELDQEQIIQTILALGNEIWSNFGQEGEIDDYSVFFQHQFYIRCFQMAYPGFDFSALLNDDESENPEKMAECIQALIDLLSQEILMYDFNHIRGEEIVGGNPEHCINLLQILQQISSDSMIQDGGANNENNENQEQKTSSKSDSNQQQQISVGNQSDQQSFERSSANDDGIDKISQKESDNEKQDRVKASYGKNSDKNQKQQELFNAQFDFDEFEDGFERGQADKGQKQNKQQFVDNLNDELQLNDDGQPIFNQDKQKQYKYQKYQESKGQNADNSSSLGVENVGDAIGKQLDIEFDDDIQDNLQNVKGRGSKGSGYSSEEELAQELNKNLKHQILDGEDNDFEDDGEVIDHNEVNIIDDGPYYNDEQNQDDQYENDDGELRNLNRQTDNIANIQQQVERGQYDFDKDQQEYQDENDMIDGYGEEDEQQQNQDMGQYKPIDYQIDRSLYQLHDQLRFDKQKNQDKQIIDDQNLNMDPIEGDNRSSNDMQDEEEEEQQDEEEEQELNLDDIDPRNFLEAAHELGLDEEGIRLLQQEMYNNQAQKNEEDDENQDYGHESMDENNMRNEMKDDEEIFDEENDREVQELAEMLNGVKENRNQGQQSQDDEMHQMIDSEDNVGEYEDEEDFEENDDQILRGGQNIEDEKEEKLQELEEEMAQQLNMINSDDQDKSQQRNDDEFDQEQDGEQEEEEEGDQLIDIDNLEDNEKAILWQYLHEEYKNNPDSLPMPKEVVEQFLSDNHDLVQRIIEQQQQVDENEYQQQDEYDQEYQGEGEDPEYNNNGINSNEIEIEKSEQNEDANIAPEIVHNENDINDEDDNDDIGEDEQNSNEIEAVENDALEQQMNHQQLNYQQARQNQMDDQQDLNIDEIQQDDNQDDEEDEEDENIDDQQDMEQMQREGYPEDEQYEQQEYDDEQDIEGNGEDDVDQNQIFNAQYGLDQIQEEDQEQDGMGSDININLQGQQFSNLSQEQINQLYLQQQMQLQLQGNQQQFLAQKKTISKKKRVAGGLRKPITNALSGMAIRKNVQLQAQGAHIFNPIRPLNAAANKKFKRQKYVINTINHDEDYAGANMIGIDVPNRGVQKRASSYLNRPQTAKSKKSQVIKLQKKGQQQFKGVSITPSNISKSVRVNGIVQSHGNLLVPQQSQMFTSFGLAPNGENRLGNHAQNVLSQRKSISNSRKNKFVQGIYGSVKGILNKNKPKVNKIPKNIPFSQKKSSKVQKSQNQWIQQNQNEILNNQQNIVQLDKQQLNVSNNIKLNQFDYQQNIVEMPILSEEFLNQLNEEQLQALLEQQQQLMMLQQQSQQQSSEVYTENGGIPSTTNPQNNFINMTENEDAIQTNNEQLQSFPVNQVKAQKQGSNLRTRGRSKQHIQSSLQQIAARIPSANRKKVQAKGTSGSRSAHGSKKRAQKTRSSLNIALPLNIASMSNLGQIPNIFPQGSNSVFKSQKLAAQIYGNSAEQMIQNIISQRSNKKRGFQQGMGSKLGLKKRSQPNQAGKQLAQKLNKINPGSTYDMQQQILQQQQQYNQHIQQQKQQTPHVQMNAPDEIQEDEIDNIQEVNDINNIAIDLSTEQIIQLLEQNHQNQIQLMTQGENQENINQDNSEDPNEQIVLLPQDVQIQLQQVLQDRLQNASRSEQVASNKKPISQQIQGMAINNRVQSYQNICNILTESVSKAKQKYQNFSQKSLSNSPIRSQQESKQNKMIDDLQSQQRLGGIESDQRVLQQKKQFENLLKQYQMELKIQENKRVQDLKRAEKIALRDEKIKQIKQKKIEELMLSKQKSQIIKRNAQQAKIQKRVMKLAQDLEKDKVLNEKKYIKDIEIQNFTQKKAMVATIENYYKDKINLLKERIEQEKFDRSLAQEAQKKAMTQMKKELGEQKKKEVQRYIELLQQEDDKFDIQNLNLGKLENDIVKLYKKQ